MPTLPLRHLETVDNPEPDRVYRVRMVAPEFTCLCPRTGQPDFATIVVEYAPSARLVELKALKLYLWSWREEGAFHEAVTNRIADDLYEAARPRWLNVTGLFRVRGGITTTVSTERGARPDGLPEFAAGPEEREA